MLKAGNYNCESVIIMAKQHSSFEGLSILVVQKHIRLLRNMAFLLTMAGFDVMSASDGAAALEMLEGRAPDLIIADTDLPTVNGYQLLGIVRSTDRWAHIPFIFTSDKYEYDDLMHALDLGADDYLPKPFDLYDLVDAIARTMPRQMYIRKIAS
jgi:DNA-binding response OmpR family regulator